MPHFDAHIKVKTRRSIVQIVQIVGWRCMLLAACSATIILLFMINPIGTTIVACAMIVSLIGVVV